MKTKFIFISILFIMVLLNSVNIANADNGNSIIYGITSSSLVVYDPNENTLSSYYITTTLKDFTVTPSYIFITSLDSTGYYNLNVVSTKDYQLVYTIDLSSTYSNSQNVAASNDGNYAFVLVNGDVKRVDWRNNQTTSLSLSDTSIRSIQMNPDSTILEIGGFNTGYSVNPDTFTIIHTETPSAVYDRMRVSRSNILGIDLTSTPKKRNEADHLFGYLPGSTTVLNNFATPSGIDNVDGSTSQYYVVYSNNDAVFYGYNGATPLYFNSSSSNNDIAVSNDGTLLYLASSTNNQINVYASNNSHTSLGFINTPGVVLRLQNGYRAVEYTATSTHSVKFTVSSLFGSILFKNVIVTVTDSNNNILYSQSTGDDGSVVFPLQSTKLYTITAYNQTQNIDTTITLYTVDSAYVIDAGLNPIINFNGLWHSADINQSYTFNNGTGDPLRDVILTVSQSPHTIPIDRSITATYNDDTASTSNVNFTLYKMDNNVSTYITSVSKSPNALQLNGNGYINIDSSGGVHNTATNTIEIIVDGQPQPNKIFYSEAQLGASTGPVLFIRSDATGIKTNIFLRDDLNNQVSIDGTKTVLDGTPHMISWVDNNDAYALYVDGELDVSGTYVKGTKTLNSTTIGATRRLAISSYYTGIVDDVRLWTVARSQVDIRSTMFTELVGTEAGLKAYYKLNSGAGTSAIDSTSNHYDGTIVNGDWVQIDSKTIFLISNETQNKAPSSYKIVVDANTGAYGNIERVGYASWDGTGYLLPGLGLDNKALPYAWICFGVVFLIAIIGTYLSNGVITFVAGGAWEVMIALGWMDGSAQNYAVGALVMAIGVGYILMQKRREQV